MAENQDADNGGKKKSKLKLIIVLLLVVIMAIGVSVGATLFFLTDGDDPDGDANGEVTEEPSGPVEAFYFVFEQPFVVSLTGERQRYLQLHLAVVMRDHDVTAQLERHNPTIRSRLQSLLARQRFEDLQSDDAREGLREEILNVINGVMAEEEAEAVEQVLYTNFVMQ